MDVADRPVAPFHRRYCSKISTQWMPIKCNIRACFCNSLSIAQVWLQATQNQHALLKYPRSMFPDTCGDQNCFWDHYDVLCTLVTWNRPKMGKVVLSQIKVTLLFFEHWPITCEFLLMTFFLLFFYLTKWALSMFKVDSVLISVHAEQNVCHTW